MRDAGGVAIYPLAFRAAVENEGGWTRASLMASMFNTPGSPRCSEPLLTRDSLGS